MFLCGHDGSELFNGSSRKKIAVVVFPTTLTKYYPQLVDSKLQKS